MSTLRKLRRTSHTGENRLEPILWESLPFTRKMSEVLLEFAEPLLEDSDDDESFSGKIAVAVLCWNLAILPPNEREAELDSFVDELGGRVTFRHSGIHEALQMFIDRKKALFAYDNRLIINYEIVEEKTGPRLLVMSTPFDDGHPPSPQIVRGR